MNVWISGKRVSLKPTQSIGKGGEADIFDLGDGRALKLFKGADHVDYQGLPQEQAAAEKRIEEHQQKLRQFPKGLPATVIAPQETALESLGGRIVGFTMPKVSGAEPLYRLAEPTFRRAGYPSQDVVALFERLHSTLAALHHSGVVIGDFNDRNVLVTGTEPKLIDADSFQFGRYLCSVFTDRFVDPLLCDGGQGGLLQTKPHAADSDWYAFAVLLMQSLLFVGPYGGIYRPKDQSQKLAQASRPLLRITVFHPEVQYPKPAANLKSLPDDLLECFLKIFTKDERGSFPLRELQSLHFTRCPSCQTEHARATCPTCSPSAAMASKVVSRVRGEVTCTTLFETRGMILAAAIQGGVLGVVHHENGAFRREDGSLVMRGELSPRLRFALRGASTMVGRGNEVAILEAGRAPQKLMVDRGQSFATDGRRAFWVQDGRMMREGALGIPEQVGEALANQTRIWVGPAFGFGLYRAGSLSVAFTFENHRKGINDQLKLPPLAGELLDADCVLDDQRAWLRLVLQTHGRTRHLCMAWSRLGNLEAMAETPAGDGSWLGTMGGACATGGVLLVATDSGIVRVEVAAGRIEPTREFPDTEPFVNSSCNLLVGREGLLVVKAQEVVALKMP